MSSTAKQWAEEILQRTREKEFPNHVEITVCEGQWKRLIRLLNDQTNEIKCLNADRDHMLDLVNNASAALCEKDREIDRLKGKLQTVEDYAFALVTYAQKGRDPQ